MTGRQPDPLTAPASGAPDEEDPVFSLFHNEEQVITRSLAMIDDLHTVADGVRALADAYRQSYREQRRLVRLSDRIQLELQTAKREQQRQAEALALLNQSLREEIERREHLEAELRAAATTDSLTGFTNRRHFTECLEREIKRQDRFGHELSLMILDLDRFKSINDTHGHNAGDAVLRAFAEVCRLHLRETDIVGRVGGEEFAVVLPETDAAGAAAVAERIRAGLAACSMPLPGGAAVGCTVSIGVCNVRGDWDFGRAMRLADRAMYRAKQAGRNRVEIAEDEDDA